MNYSITIPVLRLEEGPRKMVEDLLQALEQQRVPPKEVHLVVGDRRQGRAINYGVDASSTTYVATLDDDSFIDDPELFEKLLASMENDASLGMVGAACTIPDWATPFQKKAMVQIPRRFFPVQKETNDSDMVQHPCLMMRKDEFQKMGGEDEELIRGLDPVLRKKVRDAGLRVAIVADTWVYHLLPDGFLKLLRMYFRNGVGSGYAQKHFPDRVLELSDGYDEGQFVEKRSWIWRVMRRFLGLLGGLVKGQWIRIGTDLAYGLGVFKERLWPSPGSKVPKRKGVHLESWEGFTFEVKIHRVELD
jgi:glycosyltransferase involved in cell wall biosynthesis